MSFYNRNRFVPRRHWGYGRTSNRRFTMRSTRGGRRFNPYRGYPSKAGLTPQEHKVSTINIATHNPFDTAVITSVFSIAQGTGVSARVGDIICLKKLMMRVCMNATATSIGGCYRILLLYDKQANRGLPTADAIFVGGAPHSSRDYLDLINRNRFSTIMNSGIFNVGANTNDNDNRSMEFYCNLRAEVTFDGAGAGVGSVITGNLVYVAVGDGTVATNAAAFDVQFRTRFTDGQLVGNKEAKFFNRKLTGNFNKG